ncbi:redoxin domain-containing protein [Adhaeretor mobilis]|uniref:Thiol-disulfide oxidoreductase ResA n=1 Tax=Adhaeretor mobilis TaxID=1930276 RepID=A0A517MTU6_9BACT|nr:redoxin domain-containing protein [Adhaeretor mobilis]QDS98305.1 Thiol-disulfide oxidoreductase ResA [Adhaeretor mobilis]
MRFLVSTVLVFSFGFALVAPCEAAEKQIATPEQIESFTLKDFRGRAHSLSEIEEQLVVVAYLGTECPLAKLYGPRLVELRKKYASRGVSFLAINANLQDSITELAAYARIHQIDFPILKDVGNQVADLMQAERTPQVFVLDQDRKIRYSGRIDDQYGVGYVRDAPERQDLAIALDELLAGKSVSTPKTTAVGCKIGRQREPVADAEITYSNRIAHIFQNRCVECHREGDIAPFALEDYDEVAGWAEMIEEVVREQRMPPWHADPAHGDFTNDRHLSDEERQAIYQWVEDGAPQGDPDDLPEPREFVTGWQLPQSPDAVYTIQKEPFRVRAEGEVKYQWFQANLDFDEDKWVSGVEILPGNRAVVHHILAFVLPPGDLRTSGAGRGFFAGYVPGLRAKMLPAGTAKLLPAGSKLIFQVHYTPIGSVQFDQSKIGLVFIDRKDVTRRAISSSAITNRFAIPPGDSNYRVEAGSRSVPWDAELLSMSPHLHLRGKSFRYEAILPDGSKQVLLNVPHYDFNWQTEYRLSQGIPMPKGSRIHAVAHYDNSTANLSNPNPDVTVRWGDQSWDEMMIGYFLISVPVDAPVALPESELRLPSATAKKRVSRIFLRTDKNGDGEISLEEAPTVLKKGFAQADKDNSGGVSPDEFRAALDRYRLGR